MNTGQKEGVRFQDDILKEVSAEINLSQKEVEEIWKLHVSYVKEKMLQEDTHVIDLPFIGNLYYSIFTEKVKKSKQRKNKEETKRSKKIRTLIQEDKDVNRKTKWIYPQNKRNSLYNFFFKVQKIILKKNKKYTSRKKAIEFIEEYSKNNNK